MDITSLEKLVNRRATVLIFIPNTNELQRFILSGAFNELTNYYEVHYVLPSQEAEKMRAMSKNVLTLSNSTAITLPIERFEKWSELYQTECFRSSSISPSFAIRANLILRNDRLFKVIPKLLWKPAYQITKCLLHVTQKAGFVPHRIKKWNHLLHHVLHEAVTQPQQIDELQKDKYNNFVQSSLSEMSPSKEIVSLFDRFNPLFCIAPTSLLDIFCNDVTLACEAEQISCVILQSGWGNLSSKGIIHQKDLFLGCWGPQSSRHAERIQGLQISQISSIGAPHYEFLKLSSTDEIQRLRTKLGVKENEKLILFGGSFRQFDETSILKQLDQAISNGKLNACKILYRPHPWRAARQHEEDFFQFDWKHVIFDPDMRERYQKEQAERGFIKRNIPIFDMSYLSQLLSAVDIVISPMSTLLVEALIIGKPTIAIAFGDGKHTYNPSVTAQMTHFTELKTSPALIWCDAQEQFLNDCARLVGSFQNTDKNNDSRQTLIAEIVTRETGTYAKRLAYFCQKRVEPKARKLRGYRATRKRGSISHAYGANLIARDYCGLSSDNLAIPGYWIHGWIPSYHNIDPAFIAVHKKEGQHDEYAYLTQIRNEKENVAQWVGRNDQTEYLISHGYKNVKAIGLPFIYLPPSKATRIPGSLLVLPPHSHKNHGKNDPLAEEYAEMIAALKPHFQHIWVGLHEDDMAKKQWIGSFQKRDIPVFMTTDQADPYTLSRLKDILSTFEYVTTNGYGSHIALAAYCGAKVSIYGPYADFPLERMKVTFAIKIFPKLLNQAYYLCTEEALRQHYPFLFVEPHQAVTLQEWGAKEMGEPCKLAPEELAELFGWLPKKYAHDDAIPSKRKNPTILFGMAHAGFYRNFETTINSLLEKHIDIHVYFSKDHETIKMNDYCLPPNAEKGRLSYTISNTPYNTSLPIEQSRILRDIIHYSNPAFRRAYDLRTRFTSFQKKGVISEKRQARLQKIFDFMPSYIKNKIELKLSKNEENTPPTIETIEIMEKINPDYVIVTPLVNIASREIDLVKAAKLKKIPTLLATASWDNLTNKRKILTQPDNVAVWNQAMADEARTLHGVPSHKIWITGAAPFDGWFNQQPSRDKETFCSLLQFDIEKPIIVYLCSSYSIAGESENDIIRQWSNALISSSDEKLMHANVLIRPHPMALKCWHELMLQENHSIGKIWGTKIWPLNVKHPTTKQSRADFFDTLYYADAIVGLNTSAMIEAAILGKPVLTFLGHDATLSQTGNIHFNHLKNGGFMFQANNLQEHIQQLIEVLNSPESFAENCEKFVAQFVRPFGKEISASEQLSKCILEKMNV